MSINKTKYIINEYRQQKEINRKEIDILKETIEIINSRLLIKEEHIQTLIEKIDTLYNLNNKSNE